MRRFFTPIATVAALATAAVVLVAPASPAVAADRQFVLTKGHIDLFEVSYDTASSGLRLQVKDDTNLHATGSVLRNPADVTIAVDDEAAATQVPSNPAYSFLGAAGSTVYQLPMTQDADLPWPGWSTERLTSTLPAGTQVATGADAVKLAVEVDGPGDVHSFMVSPFGEPINRYVDSSNGGPDTIPISRSAHVHTSWSFSELGDYTFTVTPTATTTTGGTLTGPPASYHVRVGDAPAADLGLTVIPNKAGATYLYGQGITLTAAPTAATDLDHYHWFIKPAGASQFSISERSSSAELKLPTSLTWDGAQVYAALYGNDHEVVAQSEPLTLDVSALPAPTVITAAADKTSYAVGDVATFTSTQTPPTGEDHFHWYVRKPGEEFYTWINGTNSADAELPITADLNGAEVAIRLFNHDHAVLAESAPVVLSVGAPAAAVTTSTTVRLSAPRQQFGTPKPRTATVRVAGQGITAAGTVTLTAGARNLGRAAVKSGVATVRLPARLAVGAHRVTARFVPKDPAAQSASASTPVSLRVVKATVRAKATPRRAVVAKGARGRLVVTLAGNVRPTGKLVVRSKGKQVAVASVRGKRTVITLRKLSPGRHPLTVSYAGNKNVAKATARTALVVRR